MLHAKRVGRLAQGSSVALQVKRARVGWRTARAHGGFVMRSGTTGEKTKQLFELRLALESNPEFTASVLVACARACARMHQRGDVGAKTVFDIAPALLSPRSAEELRREML